MLRVETDREYGREYARKPQLLIANHSLKASLRVAVPSIRGRVS